MTSGFKAATAAASVGLAAPPSLPVPAARLRILRAAASKSTGYR